MTEDTGLQNVARNTRILSAVLFPSLPHGTTVSSGPGSTHYQGFIIRHTTIGRTPLDERSVQSWGLYLTTHNIHKKQTSMSSAGFELTIPASEGPQTHDLDPNFNNTCTNNTPNPAAARSKAWVCEISFAGIVGSNPAGAMDVCAVWMLCVVRKSSLSRADLLSRGVLPTVVCLSVIVKPGQWEDPGPLGTVAKWGGGLLKFDYPLHLDYEDSDSLKAESVVFFGAWEIQKGIHCSRKTRKIEHLV